MNRPSLALLLALGLATTLGIGQALSDESPGQGREKEDKEDNAPVNEALEDPVVQGMVIDVFYSDGKDPKNRTPTLLVWSNEADQAVKIYGDVPVTAEAIKSGRACVGRFVIAGGDRLDVHELSALAIEVHDLNKPCTKTLQ